MTQEMTIRRLRKKPFGGIDAGTLRILAIVFMLLDHMWATIIPANFWMTCVGRLAFPIFAFQTAEGFFHTSNRHCYGKRLLLAALIAEVPFDLMLAGGVFFPFHQNTIFTLLLGLWAISGLEHARQNRTGKAWMRGILVLTGALLLAVIGMVDYGYKGVLTVVAFYLFRGFRFAWIGQLVSMILLNIILFEGRTWVITLLGHTFCPPVQGLAVLALLPIWLYNGKKGPGGKALQCGTYAFYPAHLLILYLLMLCTN